MIQRLTKEQADYLIGKLCSAFTYEAVGIEGDVATDIARAVINNCIEKKFPGFAMDVGRGDSSYIISISFDKDETEIDFDFGDGVVGLNTEQFKQFACTITKVLQWLEGQQ